MTSAPHTTALSMIAEIEAQDGRRIADVGVVGAVTVAGLPRGADHAPVVEALRSLLG